MGLSDNPFIGLSASQLASLQAAYLQCTLDIANAGQSYTMGRTFTRANLSEVKKTLSDINTAIVVLNRRGTSRAIARVNTY